MLQSLPICFKYTVIRKFARIKELYQCLIYIHTTETYVTTKWT